MEEIFYFAKFSVQYLNIYQECFFIKAQKNFLKPAIFIKFNYQKILQIFAVIFSGNKATI